jgi:hypothetical protein
LLLLAAAGWLWAGERSGTGKRALPPDVVSAVWPEENPLAKPGASIPVPPILWEKVAVRPDHPRLLFNKETLETVRARFRGHPMERAVMKLAKEGDPLATAFIYQIGGEEVYAQKAIALLLAGRTPDPALVYDWTYDAMTEEQRREATQQLWAGVAMDRNSGWPRCSPYTSYPDDPRPSETPPDRWLPYYNWTFHDQDWARHYASSYAALMALAHHVPRAAEGVRNVWEYSLKDPVLFFDYLRNGDYWQGDYWSPTARIHEIVRLYLMMRTATGVDALDPKVHPYLGSFGRWLLYCSDPWKKQVIYNYGDGEMVRLGDRPRRCLLASNSLIGDPHVEWLVRTACPEPTVTDWLLEVLYHDPGLVPKPPDSLPPSRAFPGTGFVVMRSGWRGTDVWASVRWADFFDIHDHYDVGSFILYCRGPLVPDSGINGEGLFHPGHYYSRPVAHNTLLVRDPAVQSPVFDGGQPAQPKRTWSFAIGRDAWVYDQEAFNRADLLAFESHPLYDYCAGTGTRAYRPEQVKEFARQVVFLRAGALVIFDRVETTRPELDKRWLLHTVGEPRVDGKLLSAEVPGHIEEYDGHLTVSQGNESAIVRCHTLLPAKAVVRRVGGSIPKIPSSTLVRVPKTTHRMGTGSRWAWTDPLILYYNDELTQKKLGALCIERNSPTDAEYEVTDREVHIKLHAYERGRTDEVRVKLADCPTLLDVVREVGRADLWHCSVHYLPGYEYYTEGVNYAPAYGLDEWVQPVKLAPELTGEPSDYGSWRIEVRPAKPATRDYFLHVLRVQRTAEDELGEVAGQDAPDRAQATVTLGGRTYAIAFAKTGELGGHIRITEADGTVAADADFVSKIVQEEWRY